MLNIFLLMGQSNMAGRGILGDVEPIEDDRIHSFQDGCWIRAKEPLHHDRPTAGIGLAMSFAQRLLERDPESEVGFVPCAVGSTALARWLPDADLYSRSMRAAKDAAREGTLRGILWHQGEHDSLQAKDASSYLDRFATMVEAARKELEAADLPILVGELGRFLKERKEFTFYQIVNACLKEAPRRLPRCGWISSENLTDKGDHLHFDAASLREFGKRYAAQYLRLTG